MAIFVDGNQIQTTPEGFLRDASAWNAKVAEKIGAAHGIALTDYHWEVLTILREYCDAGNEPPSMRFLVKELQQKLTGRNVTSIYLMKLFGASPAKMAARLAGLPKPKNCL